MGKLTLREQLMHMAQQWRWLADEWDREDLAAHVKAQNSPVTFMSTARVNVLLQCSDALRHALEEHRDE